MGAVGFVRLVDDAGAGCPFRKVVVPPLELLFLIKKETFQSVSVSDSKGRVARNTPEKRLRPLGDL